MLTAATVKSINFLTFYVPCVHAQTRLKHFIYILCSLINLHFSSKCQIDDVSTFNDPRSPSTGSINIHVWSELHLTTPNYTYFCFCRIQNSKAYWDYIYCSIVLNLLKALLRDYLCQRCITSSLNIIHCLHPYRIEICITTFEFK